MRAGSSPTPWRWDEANTTVVATRMEYARLNLEIKDTWWRYGKLHTLLGRLEYPLCATVMSYAPLDSQDTQDTQIKKITRAHRKIPMQNTLYIPRKQHMLRDASARETQHDSEGSAGDRVWVGRGTSAIDAPRAVVTRAWGQHYFHRVSRPHGPRQQRTGALVRWVFFIYKNAGGGMVHILVLRALLLRVRFWAFAEGGGG